MEYLQVAVPSEFRLKTSHNPMFILLFLKFSGVLLTGLALGVTLCLGSPLRRTSLTAAWKWGIAAEFAWFLTSIVTAFASPGAPILDQGRLWTAILTVCPLIAALGARRPASRVWGWFIVLPLMAVLGWPAFTVMSDWPELAPLKVQTPICIGFALVMVMGVGNYVGTRFSGPALLAGLATILCILPLSTRSPLGLESAVYFQASAEILFAAAVFMAIRQGLRNGTEESPFDRLWFDFRDTFGIVWSVRIQERLNETAEKESWNSRLGPTGFDWQSAISTEQRQETLVRMQHALRWHLRRFVDPEWIDERLGEQTAPIAPDR